MPTLLIEHSISDFGSWNEAFTRFAPRRAEGGVLHERIMQPIDDLHYVFIELDFATREAAQRFKQFLETTIWANPTDSPALVGSPRARVADTAPLDHRSRRSDPGERALASPPSAAQPR